MIFPRMIFASSSVSSLLNFRLYSSLVCSIPSASGTDMRNDDAELGETGELYVRGGGGSAAVFGSHVLS